MVFQEAMGQVVEAAAERRVRLKLAEEPSEGARAGRRQQIPVMEQVPAAVVVVLLLKHQERMEAMADLMEEEVVVAPMLI
jgi:hypothetical protein